MTSLYNVSNNLEEGVIASTDGNGTTAGVTVANSPDNVSNNLEEVDLASPDKWALSGTEIILLNCNVVYRVLSASLCVGTCLGSVENWEYVKTYLKPKMLSVRIQEKAR